MVEAGEKPFSPIWHIHEGAYEYGIILTTYPLSMRAMKAYLARKLRIVFVAVTLVLIFSVLLWLVTDLPRQLLALRGISLPADQLLTAEASIRSSLIQLLGGLVVVAGLYFTAKGFNLTREGHITDRYSKAIEHLGSQSADIRIGGIYALARIARDSSNDYAMVIEVLTAFVREHTSSGHREPSEKK